MAQAIERVRLQIALGVAVFGLFVIFGFTAAQGEPGSYFVAGDGHYLAMTARSLGLDGDLDLTNQYRVFGDRWGLGRWPADDGWRLPPRELGPALLMIPGLWLHDFFDLAPAPWGTWLAIGPALTPALCFWLLSFRLQRMHPHAPTGDALVAALVGVLAFVLPFYAWGRSAYPHAGDALAMSLVLFTVLDDEWRPSAIGLSLALAISMRYQNALWLLWPTWLVLRRNASARERIRELAPIYATASLALTPLAYLALAHPGSDTGVIRWTAEFFNLEAFGSDLLDVLVGVHGLVTWTPIVLVALLGLCVSGPRMEARRGAAIVLVLLCLLMASVRDPNAGTAFGARRLAGLTPFVAWGLHRLVTRARERGGHRPLFLTYFALTVINAWAVWAAIVGRIDLSS